MGYPDMNLQVTDTNGSSRTIEIAVNPSGNLMEVLVDEGFDVPAICGGMASCATCHVRFETGGEKLDEPEEDELFLLEGLGNRSSESRLSCQVPTTELLDQAQITVLGDGF
ncbi:MAG: 2Fe-2S iron-sulfur cluster-binding protein [Bacteroidota bacterium]